MLGGSPKHDEPDRRLNYVELFCQDSSLRQSMQVRQGLVEIQQSYTVAAFARTTSYPKSC